MNFEQFPNDSLGKEYLSHGVFEKLKDLTEFYYLLSYSVMGFSSSGTESILNLDTYVFTSISGTLDSIHDILKKGRINDAYALLRKYYDSTIINIYTNLYLSDNFSIENFVVEKIEDWRSGKERLPEYRLISQYIKDSPKLKPITDLLEKDRKYKEIRDRCNDHTHYNYYHNLLLNDNQIYNESRVKVLNRFSSDLSAIFVQHFSYLFYLKDYYMSSSDYVDSLELGLIPEIDSQYLVAPFIQDIFNKRIKPDRPDIAEEIKSKTCMKLE